MAKSTTRPPRKPTPISSNTAVEETLPDIQDAIPPAFEPPAAAEAAAESTAPRQEVKPPKTPTFYQTINKIPKADWGPRANIYLYRVEPVIDRTRSGDSKFINTYAEPVNEDRVMADYGSGKYKLILNFRKAGADTGDVLDSVYMDILNMKYPPKIPLGEWTDDPRNKKWAWAKEANGTPASAAPAVAPMDPLAAFGTFMDIQDRVQERMTPAAPPTPPAPVDPWAAAEKILNMRSDNPMVEILKEQMKASAASAEAERDRAFKAAESAREREFKLQEKLLEAKTAAPASKSFIDQALELANNSDKLEPLKKLAGFFGLGGGSESVGRPGKTTGMDIIDHLVSGPAGAQLAQGLGSVLMALPSMFQGNPANGAPHPPPVVLPPIAAPPPQPETPEQRIQRIGEAVTRQMLGEFFMKNATGADFAASMHNFWPEDTVFLQSLGAENLVNRYRRYPQAWSVISYREADFIQFITEFCAWTPEEDEGPVPPGNGDDGVVDLEPEVGA
jgi:hypothetical protein